MSRLACLLGIFQAFLIQNVVSFMLPELCATRIRLVFNLLPCGPAPAMGTAGACIAQLGGDGELSFLSCALLSPSEVCNGCRDRSCQGGEGQQKKIRLWLAGWALVQGS